MSANKMYSSPNGGYPQELPNYWRNSPEEELIDLSNLSDEQLDALGWKGPVQMPPLPGTSHFTHDYEWNSETISFDAIEFDEYEKRKRVSYQKFWDLLVEGSRNDLDTSSLETFKLGPYYKIKLLASESLKINVIATEFIALLTDAKNGAANVRSIQDSLFQIIENIPFTQEEGEELQRIFIESGMFAIYTLEMPPR